MTEVDSIRDELYLFCKFSTSAGEITQILEEIREAGESVVSNGR